MRFQFEGKTYSIEFQRDYSTHRSVSTSPEATTTTFVKDTFPYTIARIMLHTTTVDGKEKLEVWRTAKVGCWHQEKKFSLETGRLRALRNITRTIPKPMKPLMWDAYHSRPRGKNGVANAAAKPVVAETVTPTTPSDSTGILD